MKTKIEFSKMHGLGNDFVVIDATVHSFHPEKSWIQQIANRYTGIGFDQLLIVGKSENADFTCTIFNSDGSQAEQCGNGMRCVARFIHEKKLSQKKTFSIETKGGIVSAMIHDYDAIEIRMAIPQLFEKEQTLENIPFKLTTLSMGNPHALAVVENLEKISVAELGIKIATHQFFPKGTNVGFMQVIDRGHIRLKTFERGVGETFACGSNACAAVVAGIWHGLLDSTVRVRLALGELLIRWDDIQSPVIMQGPAELVFIGEIW